MEQWNDLFVATAGSAAALAGLLFVAVSINLPKILIPDSTLPERALIALLLLISILLLSICLLIPSQTSFSIGIENLIIGLILWLFILRKDIYNWRKTLPELKRFYIFSIFLNQVSTLSYLVSAVLFLSGAAAAPYFLVVGFLISFIKGVADTWVLLIEINR